MREKLDTIFCTIQGGYIELSSCQSVSVETILLADCNNLSPQL